MKCEAKYHGDEYCPKDAEVRLSIDIPLAGGEKALCYKHLAEELMQYGVEDKVKSIEIIDKD